jgi:N-acetylglutamate synthase-like GNAT family acetyltransferase
MKPIIRPYNKEDRLFCMEAFKSNVPLYFTKEEVGDYENFLIKNENKDESEKAIYFVILHDEKVIGCGGFGEKENTNIVTLAWGLIHNDYHKKGFGKALLLYRFEEIKKLFPNFPVVIDTTQFSYPFFEKFGFEITKITNDYYAEGMHRYDMRLK